MSRTKTRMRMAACGAVLLVVLTILVFIRHERIVHLERVQGAWEGAMHFHWGALLRTRRVVLRVFKVNGSYHALIDQIDTGARNLPASKFDVGRRSVSFELGSGFSYRGKLSRNATEITGRWKWPGGFYSQPLTLTRTNKPDAVPEALAMADYTPRPDSDLQGFWMGTLRLEETSLRLHLKIAGPSNGTFRAELDSIDQTPVIPLAATTVSYQRPRLRIWFQGIGAVFNGELNNVGSEIRGEWSQVKTAPLNLERVDPKEEMRALEAGKNYHYTNDTELQGHWTGILPDNYGLPLHVAVNIAQLPDGTFSATLDSPDQSLFDMPFDEVAFAPPKVHLEMKSTKSTLEGTLLDGRVCGTWIFGGKDPEPLTLERKRSD